MSWFISNSHIVVVRILRAVDQRDEWFVITSVLSGVFTVVYPPRVPALLEAVLWGMYVAETLNRRLRWDGDM